MARKPKENVHAEPGHNSGEMAAAERKAIYMDHFRPIAAQLAKVKVEQAEYKRLRRMAKADKIKLADIDYGLRCAEIDDGSIIVDDLKRQAEIASWFALPVDFQPDMFGSFDREPAVDRAAREGAAAGASGVGGNPYDENSPTGRAWAAAWSAEQGKARAALQAAMEKKNAAKAPDPGFPDTANGNQPTVAAAE